jgi:hypothetical protein
VTVNTLQYLLFFGAFVVPGAVSIWVYSFLVPQEIRGLSGRIADAVAFSIVNFVLLFPLIFYALSVPIIESSPWQAWLLVVACFLIAPLIWPFFLVGLLERAERRGLIRVRARTAWDDFFARNPQGCWMIVELADGGTIGGRFSEDSYASAYPQSGHLFIEELWTVDEAGRFGEPLPGKTGAILRPEDYRYVKVVFERRREGDDVDAPADAAAG